MLPKLVKLGCNGLHTESVLQLTMKVKRITEATWDHYLHISPNTSHNMEAVFSMVKKNLWKTTNRSHGRFECEFCYLGMTLGAVHIGKDYDTNLRCVKNYLWKTTGPFFRRTEKLIRGQTETTGISVINFQDFWWVSTSLLHSRAYEYSTAKVHAFSDSVLCLGKMGDDLVESWKSKFNGMRTPTISKI